MNKTQQTFSYLRWFNIHLCNFMGIPMIIHWSTVLVILLFALLDPNRAIWLLVTYFSVIPHEYGHSAAALWFGIKTRQIVMYPVGGMAMLERMPKEPHKELIVTVAGPAVTLVLAFIGLVGLYFTAPQTDDAIQFIQSLGFFGKLFFINVVLFVFNMIPCFPMDGGRILRACLGWITSYVKATWWAARIGQCIAVCLMFLGFISGSASLMITPMLIAMFAQGELNHVIMMDKKEKERAEKKAKEETEETEETEEIPEAEEVKDA